MLPLQVMVDTYKKGLVTEEPFPTKKVIAHLAASSQGCVRIH